MLGWNLLGPNDSLCSSTFGSLLRVIPGISTEFTLSTSTCWLVFIVLAPPRDYHLLRFPGIQAVLYINIIMVLRVAFVIYLITLCLFLLLCINLCFSTELITQNYLSCCNYFS